MPIIYNNLPIFASTLKHYFGTFSSFCISFFSPKAILVSQYSTWTSPNWKNISYLQSYRQICLILDTNSYAQLYEQEINGKENVS